MSDSQVIQMPRGYNWFPEWIPLKELDIEFTSSSISRLIEIREEDKKFTVVRLYLLGDKLHLGFDEILDSIKHLFDMGMKLDNKLYLVIDERELEYFLGKIINYDKELKEFTICSKNQSVEN
jgi:hypothetical protein